MSAFFIFLTLGLPNVTLDWVGKSASLPVVCVVTAAYRPFVAGNTIYQKSRLLPCEDSGLLLMTSPPQRMTGMRFRISTLLQRDLVPRTVSAIRERLTFLND